MRQRATMRDVAALAEVSVTTVSRVVNGEPGVSLDLAARVQRAREQLDYRHNLAASNLRRGQGTLAIGVLLQDVGNSFSAAMLRAVADVATRRRVAVFSASIDEDPDRERQLVADLVSRRVDGLVLMPATADQSYLFSEVRAGLAVVVVDRPAHALGADSVLVDNRGGARTAVRHLVAGGHRRIATISDLTGIHTAAERLTGYRDALAEAGLPFDQEIVRVDLRDAEAGRLAVRELLDGHDPPTAIFAGRNVLSIGTLQALKERGLSRQVALVGFDDFPMSDLVDPPVTVIRQDVARIGREAATLLLARMEGGSSQPRQVTLPTTLVPRGSGEVVGPALTTLAR